MANRYREVETLETTRLEKAVALGLIIFLLVGGLWMMERLNALVPMPIRAANEYVPPAATAQQPPIEDELGLTPHRKEAERLSALAAEQQRALTDAEGRLSEATRDFQFRREEFRTGIEASRRTPEQDRTYQAARERYRQREREREIAQQAYQAAQTQSDTYAKKIQSLVTRADQLYTQRKRAHDLTLFSLQLAYCAACLALAWFLWRRGRQVEWRYLTLLTALLIAAGLQSLFLLLGYCWRLLDQVAQLGVSILGSVACAAVLVALKRYLFSPERLARARLAAHECPNCSTPFESGQKRCWDCGRPLTDVCPACGATHLRFAPYCAECGEAVPPPAAA